MITKAGLHRLAYFTLCQTESHLFKGRIHHTFTEKPEIASLFGGTGILWILFCQFSEICAIDNLATQLLGLLARFFFSLLGIDRQQEMTCPALLRFLNVAAAIGFIILLDLFLIYSITFCQLFQIEFQIVNADLFRRHKLRPVSFIERGNFPVIGFDLLKKTVKFKRQITDIALLVF